MGISICLRCKEFSKFINPKQKHKVHRISIYHVIYRFHKCDGLSSPSFKAFTFLSVTNCTFSLFVVWQGIYDSGQTQQKDGDRGFILLPSQPAVLPRSDVGSDRVEPSPCFVIQNCQTLIPRGARCIEHVKIM